MLHKLGVRKGFSLIELLVVIGIIGVLVAVAIPAYNGYKVRAVKGALEGSLNAVGTGFAACLAVKDFANCNSLNNMEVHCPDCVNEATTTSGSWCVDIEKENQKACVQTDGGVPVIVNSWNKTPDCTKLRDSWTCVGGHGGTYTSSMTCADAGCVAGSTQTGTCPALPGALTAPKSISCNTTSTTTGNMAAMAACQITTGFCD